MTITDKNGGSFDSYYKQLSFDLSSYGKTASVLICPKYYMWCGKKYKIERFWLQMYCPGYYGDNIKEVRVPDGVSVSDCPLHLLKRY